MRVMLPEPLAMLSADTDGLHGQFLAIDENSLRIFALTASGPTVVTLAHVPVGIGTVVPAGGPAAGGTSVIIRGSFQSGATLTIGGKSVAATFVDMNTLKLVTPTLANGAQRIVVTNPTANRSPGTPPLSQIERLFTLHLSPCGYLTFRWRNSSKPK